MDNEMNEEIHDEDEFDENDDRDEYQNDEDEDKNDTEKDEKIDELIQTNEELNRQIKSLKEQLEKAKLNDEQAISMDQTQLDRSQFDSDLAYNEAKQEQTALLNSLKKNKIKNVRLTLNANELFTLMDLAKKLDVNHKGVFINAKKNINWDAMVGLGLLNLARNPVQNIYSEVLEDIKNSIMPFITDRLTLLFNQFYKENKDLLLGINKNVRYNSLVLNLFAKIIPLMLKNQSEEAINELWNKPLAFESLRFNDTKASESEIDHKQDKLKAHINDVYNDKQSAQIVFGNNVLRDFVDEESEFYAHASTNDLNIQIKPALSEQKDAEPTDDNQNSDQTA